MNNLSEEEKKAIEHLTKKMNYHKEKVLDTFVWLTLDEHYVRVLLNLIEKQQQEIKDLEIENKEIIDYTYKNDNLLDLYNKEKEKNKELEVLFSNTFKDNVAYLEKKYVEENYIPKSKIREKIKIRKEEKAECTDSIEADLLLREIYVLQELLEE